MCQQLQTLCWTLWGNFLRKYIHQLIQEGDIAVKTARNEDFEILGGGRHTPLCIAGPSSPLHPSAPLYWCSRCRCCQTPWTQPSRRPSGRSCSSGSPAPRPGSPSCSWPRPSRSRPAHICEKRAQSSDSWSACRIREAWGPELQNDRCRKWKRFMWWGKVNSALDLLWVKDLTFCNSVDDAPTTDDPDIFTFVTDSSWWLPPAAKVGFLLWTTRDTQFHASPVRPLSKGKFSKPNTVLKHFFCDRNWLAY